MKFFIDTNIILHFVPFDQVDWREIYGTETVEILLAPIVIEELDKQKRSTNQRVSKRAKTAIKKIGEIGISGYWSANVLISILTTRPNNSLYSDNSLDKEEQDDRLIAAIIDYKNSVDSEVVLITNDLGPKLKCLSFGIRTDSLPEKYELKDEEGDLIKENAKLKEEINKYRQAIPKLNLLFDNDKSFIKIIISEFDISDFKTRQMSEVKSEFPYMEIPKQDSLRWPFAHPFLSPASIEKYNSELDSFFLEYEEYLSECELYYRRVSLTESIKFKLINTGSIPASDVDVKLHFPDGFTLQSDMPTNDAEKPRPPFKPGQALTLNPSIFSSLISPQIGPMHFPGKGSPSIKKTNSYDVVFDVGTLKHNQDYIFDEVLLIFDSFGEAQGFTIDYKIFAGNIPEVLTGKLNVIVEKNKI